MIWILLFLLVCLYPYFKKGSEILFVDIVWLIFQPVKIIVLLIIKIKELYGKLLSKFGRNR